MRPFQARYVTACQQVLALAAVLAVLTPATGVLNLEVVQEAPSGPEAGQQVQPQPPSADEPGVAPASERRATQRPAPVEKSIEKPAEQPAEVPAETVEPTVTEVALTAPAAQLPTPGAQAPGTTPEPPAATQRRTSQHTVLVSDPQPVTGYGAVGVTWSSAESVAEDALDIEVRSQQDGEWKAWEPATYHPEEAPDADSAEGRATRPGTDALIVGDVDQVQVRVTSTRALPADMELAVVDPGEATVSEDEAPAIDTSELGEMGEKGQPVGEGATLDSDQGEIALQATTVTQKPQIFSRAQWGADESLRDKSSLRYYEVHAGFVHHTVTSNSYTRADVPAIIRSIYAYHTRSRGWSDIGYNFLVDRFGRIWEGRYGGVDRPVVGAHTLGYNDYSFAMSALGNYDVAQPSDAMVRAYGRLFAWKLSLHGVDPSSTRQKVGPDYFQAINGHRDAGQTACPGRYLYAKIPLIRQYAKADQADWSGREMADDIAGTAYPDIVVRRASDKRLLTIPTGGLLSFGVAKQAAGFSGRTTVATGDLTGDGKGDLLVRLANGSAEVRPGDGRGGYGARKNVVKAFAGANLLAHAGDLNKDGRADVVARTSDTLTVFLGAGNGWFNRVSAGTGWSAYDTIAGPGDVTGDGRADLVLRSGSTLTIRPGLGNGRFGTAVAVPGGFGQYDVVTGGGGDLNRDGIGDLFVRERTTQQGFVLPGRGDGTFGRGLGPIGGLKGLASVSLAQTMRTTDPDLIGVRGDSLVVRAHLGRVDLARPIDSGRALSDANKLLNVGDWDRDGHGDVVYRATGGVLWLLRGDGTGRFAAPAQLATGFGSVGLLAAAGDVTGDGLPDLMGQPSGASMRIYPGNGTAGLKASYPAYGSISGANQIGVGRWNADGAPDTLVRSGTSLRAYPGNGPGGITAGSRDVGVNLTGYDWVLGTSDLLGRGHADLLVREKATGYLWLMPGTESGGVGARRYLGDGMGGYDLAD